MAKTAVLVLALSATFGCAGAPGQATAPQGDKPAPSASASPELTPRDIAKQATPAVVRIEGNGSLGTGFVVRKDGWIATNLHVVAGAPSLAVAFSNGKSFKVVEVIGYDRVHDVALLRIDASELPVLVLAEGDVRVGDPVVAIGHPLGLSDTVSDGLISAVRDVSPDLKVIQISAPIAPGSSGGPLFDTRGHVIGIATAVMREGQNLNFGVPVAYLKQVMDQPEPMPFESFARAMRPQLPSVVRHVPEHPMTLLGGCGEGDLRLLGQLLVEAIGVGAPIYDQGNFAACYHLYLGASHDAETKLSPTCGGPRRAMATGRFRAASLSGSSEQAWAMRDAFDGLLDVISRKLNPNSR